MASEIRTALLIAEPLGLRSAGGVLLPESLLHASAVRTSAVRTSAVRSDAAAGTKSAMVLQSSGFRSKPAAHISRPVNLHANRLEPSALLSVVSPQASAKPLLNKQTHFRLWSWTKIRSALLVLYAALVGFLLVRIAAGLGIAFRLWRRAEPVADLEFASVPSAKPAPRVRVSPDLTTPVTIGSTILLPADFETWDETKLRIVLAHEQSHVRQGDFYLQTIAAVHLAVFWFSPLGWWLQRKLSELGEALSDRAGLEEASSPAAYAQVLLEFAATPRRRSLAGALAGPLTGVAMARTSNLSSRIERVLNDRRFRLAFLGGRYHAVAAAILVPAALVAAVGMIRIAPPVEAAHTSVLSAQPARVKTSSAAVVNPGTMELIAQIAPVVGGQFNLTSLIQDVAPAAPTVVPDAPAAPDVAEPAPEPEQAQESDARPAPKEKRHSQVWVSDDNGESFAIVQENGDKSIHMNDNHNEEFEKARRTMHGNYIWFERDGKSYVIDNPAIVAKSQALFKGNPELDRRMTELEKKQAELNKKMADIEPEMAKAKLPGPELAQQMAKLEAELAVQGEAFKKLSAQISKNTSEAKLDQIQEQMGDLQGKIGDIQGHIGDIQGEIGEQQGRIGEKQGELGEQMGELGEQMGEIGEQQGKDAEEASRKLKLVIDQAMRDGQARPID